MTTEKNPFEELVNAASAVVDRFPRLVMLTGATPNKIQARLNIVRIDMDYTREQFSELLGLDFMGEDFLTEDAPVPPLEEVERFCRFAMLPIRWIYDGLLPELPVGAACRFEAIAQRAFDVHEAEAKARSRQARNAMN